MKKVVPLGSLNNVQLRFLCPSDIDEVRELCQDWFPVDYPYSWYEDITSSSRFYSLAAVYNGVIIGLIVAEIKPYVKLNREVSVLPLSFFFSFSKSSHLQNNLFLSAAVKIKSSYFQNIVIILHK